MPRRKPNTSGKTAPQQRNGSQLRIIGGQWRGRKLSFPELPGLRPTPDRVRETLFNWLAPIVPGSHCLDLFAGSGALGLEALSRGAASATFVDSAPAVVRQIRDNLSLLNGNGVALQASALQWLQQGGNERFDLVFLDPPFRQGLIDEVISPLLPLLADEAWIYLETGRDEVLPALPEDWSLHRDKQAGQVSYRLYHRRLLRP